MTCSLLRGLALRDARSGSGSRVCASPSARRRVVKPDLGVAWRKRRGCPEADTRVSLLRLFFPTSAAIGWRCNISGAGARQQYDNRGFESRGRSDAPAEYCLV
jgi:hypothetical protein